MKSMFLYCAAFLLTTPALAAPPAPQLASSKQGHSSVSVAVEPQLNDGRLVIKVAAQNGTAAAVAFGPASVSVSKANGQPVALSSLQQLTDDVRAAAGMKVERAPGDSPTAGAYASRAQGTGQDGSGRMDVTGFTGASTIGQNEYVRRNEARPGKPSISKAEAEKEIAALNEAVLRDSMIAPGQIAVGQIVSQKLKFAKGEDRTLHLIVHIAGDEHGFTIAAPED
jgi:hypothetical protein